MGKTFISDEIDIFKKENQHITFTWVKIKLEMIRHIEEKKTKNLLQDHVLVV